MEVINFLKWKKKKLFDGLFFCSYRHFIFSCFYNNMSCESNKTNWILKQLLLHFLQTGELERHISLVAHIILIVASALINSFNLMCIYVQGMHLKKEARYMVMLVSVDTLIPATQLLLQISVHTNRTGFMLSPCCNLDVVMVVLFTIHQTSLHVLIFLIYNRYQKMQAIDREVTNSTPSKLLDFAFCILLNCFSCMVAI